MKYVANNKNTIHVNNIYKRYLVTDKQGTYIVYIVKMTTVDEKDTCRVRSIWRSDLFGPTI